MNNNILPSDEFIEYEGQFYTNPQKGLEESNTFIDNLRNVQNANNTEINAQTRNLGTAVPSNLGGLVGGEGYWTSRYQTPQTNAVAANLRATAQAQALNEALSNNLAMYKQRYNNAYKAARKRAGGGGSPYTQAPEIPPITGGVEETTPGLTGQGRLVLDENDLAEGGVFIVEPASGNIIGEGFDGTNPRYRRNADGSYTKVQTTQRNSGGGSGR